MYRLHEKEIELKKLYAFLEKVKEAALGADYETKMQMKDIEQKTMDKIKFIKSQHAQ